MHPKYNYRKFVFSQIQTFPSVETIRNCSNESFALISLKWFVSFVRKSVRILTRSCSVIWYCRISTSSISFRFILSEAAFKRLSTLKYFVRTLWSFDSLPLFHIELKCSWWIFSYRFKISRIIKILSLWTWCIKIRIGWWAELVQTGAIWFRRSEQTEESFFASLLLSHGLVHGLVRRCCRRYTVSWSRIICRIDVLTRGTMRTIIMCRTSSFGFYMLYQHSYPYNDNDYDNGIVNVRRYCNMASVTKIKFVTQICRRHQC